MNIAKNEKYDKKSFQRCIQCTCVRYHAIGCVHYSTECFTCVLLNSSVLFRVIEMCRILEGERVKVVLNKGLKIKM